MSAIRFSERRWNVRFIVRYSHSALRAVSLRTLTPIMSQLLQPWTREKKKTNKHNETIDGLATLQMAVLTFHSFPTHLDAPVKGFAFVIHCPSGQRVGLA